jgi:hypothetical protein
LKSLIFQRMTVGNLPVKREPEATQIELLGASFQLSLVSSAIEMAVRFGDSLTRFSSTSFALLTALGVRYPPFGSWAVRPVSFLIPSRKS